MELEGDSLLPITDEQETVSMELNTSAGMDLLSQCQTHEVEGAVIIYDTESQEMAEEDKSSEDPDNFITLHASTDAKSEVQEEAASAENLDEADNETDDDETIATFVTSTGQQLALYAVEDSDEIFAVALYDESGEPPTNFHFLMKADVERLIGEGAVKTVKKPQAQPNRESKPAEKKEEIKFERLSDLQAKAEKEEAAAIQLKKVQEMQNEKKREEAAAAAAAAAAATAAAVQLKTIHLVQTEKKEEAVAAPVQLKVHETKVDIKEEVASPAQLKKVHEMKPEKKEETISGPAPAPAQLKKVHEMKTEKKDVVGASQLKKVHDLKTENKEEAAAAQLKKIHEVKTEIVEVPGPQPKAQIPKPQCRIVQKVEQKKTVGTPNRNLINRNINSPNVSTITKTTKTYGNIKSPNASTITKTYGNMKTPTGTPTITRVIKTYGNINTSSGSTIAKTTKTYGNINAPGVSTVYKTTKPIGNINSPNASTITKTTKTIGNINSPSASTITKTTKIIGSAYQPRMTQPKKETKVAYVISNDSQYVIDNVLEDLDSDTEIIEESTVQYILCDGDPSDSEMTFDELQASLQSFKANKPNVNQTKTSTPQKTEKKKETIIRYSTFLKSSSKVAPILSQKREPVTTVYRTYSKSPKKARMTNNLLHPIKKIKQEVEDSSYGDTSAFDDGHLSSDDLSRNTSKQNASMSDTPGMAKVKRSRKQQLTMVNRTDSEIIIQSTYSEGEEEPVVMKKRGRRRKKLSPDPDYNPRKVLKKAKKANRSVEVIEIDVDESERASGQDSTLEGNKGKGSSDKENETISVNDSEAEAEEEEEPSAPKKVKQPMMQCSHCNRNFRKRKALEKHVQVCPKSPAYIQKLEERKKLAAQSGKRFKCKSCEETFDIAVSLARHVRVVHSLRKKKTKTERSESSESEEQEEDVPDESMEESSPKPESARKRRGRPPAKKSLANESPSSNIELKLDSSTETLHQEPKRRGRPPGRKSVVKAPRKRSISKERSLSPDSEDAAVSSESLPKKRGKPTRCNPSKDDEQEAPEGEGKIDSSTETEKTLESTPLKKGTKPMVVLVNYSNVGKSMNSEADEKYESSDEMPLEARKKRSSKRSVSKDDKSVSSEGEKKNDSSDETRPLEARKKTRSSKTSVSKDDTEAEEKNYSSDEAPLEARKKARTSKASVAKEDSSVTAEADEKNESLDEAPLEARKKAIMSKPSTSKEDRSVSPEVKDERSKTVEEKSKEARSATPDPEKKEEKTAELSEEPKEVPAKKTVEETVQENKEKLITEPLKKRKLSKDESTNVDDPAASKTEDKVETSVEVSVEPSRKKTRSAKESISTDEESEIQIAKEKSEDSEAPSETRKRGRPSKVKLTVEEQMEALMAEDEPESSTENPTESWNRGKPSRARTFVEEELEVPVEEEKEKPAKVSEHSAEIRRKSRSSKDVPSAKEDETEISDSKESTSESSEHPRKQVR
ncbi:microtubule-associated protein futsch isoform X1 [Nasonia vitripennis]|uniref:C2H2-type domain-containing protein n=1 Tax=Nasonia vitripennis TaxID=7425 RepID=A0A7M7QM18_NASVI|nr:microtubule-associated protein futsch isoform X1 [Nasonia vitripennis]XP_032451749.1 microtubule-associated protein futsch isoform X1 [Nasonia vitripennis]